MYLCSSRMPSVFFSTQTRVYQRLKFRIPEAEYVVSCGQARIQLFFFFFFSVEVMTGHSFQHLIQKTYFGRYCRRGPRACLLARLVVHSLPGPCSIMSSLCVYFALAFIEWHQEREREKEKEKERKKERRQTVRADLCVVINSRAGGGWLGLPALASFALRRQTAHASNGP